MSAVSTSGGGLSRREKQHAALLFGGLAILAILFLWLQRQVGQYVFSTGSGQRVEMEIDLAKGNPIAIDLSRFYVPPPGIRLKTPAGAPRPLPEYDSEALNVFSGYKPLGGGDGLGADTDPYLTIGEIGMLSPQFLGGFPFYGSPGPRWVFADSGGQGQGQGTGGGGGQGTGGEGQGGNPGDNGGGNDNGGVPGNPPADAPTGPGDTTGTPTIPIPEVPSLMLFAGGILVSRRASRRRAKPPKSRGTRPR